MPDEFNSIPLDQIDPRSPGFSREVNRRLSESLRREDVEVGPNMTLDETPDGKIVLDALRPPQRFTGATVILAEITGSSAIGGKTNQWTYSAKKVQAEPPDYADVSPAVTYTNLIYNLRESGNTGSGLESGMIDVDDADFGSVTISPVPTGRIVLLTKHTKPSDGSVWYSMDVANEVDTTCP